MGTPFVIDAPKGMIRIGGTADGPAANEIEAENRTQLNVSLTSSSLKKRPMQRSEAKKFRAQQGSTARGGIAIIPIEFAMARKQ
jgi:hypothetical protein